MDVYMISNQSSLSHQYKSDKVLFNSYGGKYMIYKSCLCYCLRQVQENMVKVRHLFYVCFISCLQMCDKTSADYKFRGVNTSFHQTLLCKLFDTFEYVSESFPHHPSFYMIPTYANDYPTYDYRLAVLHIISENSFHFVQSISPHKHITRIIIGNANGEI